MPDPNETFSTLDDFLLSLAEGISQAQDELSRAGVAGPPGRQFAYHLPRLEFELKMNLQVVEDASLSNRYSRLRTAKPTNKHLLFRPVAAEESSSTLEIAGVIRGAFVAVPTNDGLPATLLSVEVDSSEQLAPVVRVRATSSAGSAVGGLQVEVNLDREESELLTTMEGISFELAEGTEFRQGLLVTDENGTAEVVLDIDSDQKRAVLALVIDAANQTETVIYEVNP